MTAKELHQGTDRQDTTNVSRQWANSGSELNRGSEFRRRKTLGGSQ